MKDFLRCTALAALALAAANQVASAQHYNKFNLVANTAGIAPVTDPNLINPWGLSRSTGSPWWISDNGSGLSTLYDGAGSIIPLVVTIPKANPKGTTPTVGSPTGTIANNSAFDFQMAPRVPAAFLFATIDGTIQAWNPSIGIPPGGSPPSKTATIMYKATDGSSYTGLASASVIGRRVLYAANFSKGRIDFFDNQFHKISLPKIQEGSELVKPFTDDQLPPNYVPFNVQSIGNDVVVTWVLLQPGNQFETDGPGLGYVDVFSSGGKLLLRLQHGDWLNAPWGVALAPLDFGTFSHALLVGQFAGGETTNAGGTIAAFDLVSGNFLGNLETPGSKPITIAGLWSISPGNSATGASYDTRRTSGAGELYFTAGPDHGTGGLFGYLQPIGSELIKGNDQ
jgi:uncharacterized protein (TIGR03118 family)